MKEDSTRREKSSILALFLEKRSRESSTLRESTPNLELKGNDREKGRSSGETLSKPATGPLTSNLKETRGHIRKFSLRKKLPSSSKAEKRGDAMREGRGGRKSSANG